MLSFLFKKKILNVLISIKNFDCNLDSRALFLLNRRGRLRRFLSAIVKSSKTREKISPGAEVAFIFFIIASHYMLKILDDIADFLQCIVVLEGGQKTTENPTKKKKKKKKKMNVW